MREANRDGAFDRPDHLGAVRDRGYFVGKRNGRVGAGVALAALLGVAGVIIMAYLPL